MAKYSMCPDRELNLHPFGIQDDTPTEYLDLARTRMAKDFSFFLKPLGDSEEMCTQS